MFSACPDLEILELNNCPNVLGKIKVFSRLQKLKGLTLGVQSLRLGDPAIEGMGRPHQSGLLTDAGFRAEKAISALRFEIIPPSQRSACRISRMSQVGFPSRGGIRPRRSAESILAGDIGVFANCPAMEILNVHHCENIGGSLSSISSLVQLRTLLADGTAITGCCYHKAPLRSLPPCPIPSRLV